MNDLKKLTNTTNVNVGKVIDLLSILSVETKKQTSPVLINGAQNLCNELQAVSAEAIYKLTAEKNAAIVKMIEECEAKQACIAKNAEKVFDAVNLALTKEPNAKNRSAVLDLYVPNTRMTRTLREEQITKDMAFDIFSKDVDHLGLVETLCDVKSHIASFGFIVSLTFTYLGKQNRDGTMFFNKNGANLDCHIGYFELDIATPTTVLDVVPPNGDTTLVALPGVSGYVAVPSSGQYATGFAEAIAEVERRAASCPLGTIGLSVAGGNVAIQASGEYVQGFVAGIMEGQKRIVARGEKPSSSADQ